MKKLTYMFGLMLLNSCAYAASQDVLTEPMKQALRHSAAVPSFYHVIFSTVIMIVLIYVVAIIYQKLNVFNAKRFSKPEDKAFIPNKMNIINCLPLGANKSLYVVEVNDKYLVVGSTQSNVSLIKEFDKKEVQGIIDSSSKKIGSEILTEPEIIEQELKTLFPKEEPDEETVIETPEEPVVQQEEQGTSFEDIYKKYI